MKGFAREAAVYAFGNVGLRLASLLLTPVYAYSLSISDFGLWATLQVTIQIMVILMSLGMRETSVRFTQECEDSRTLGTLLGTSSFVLLMGGVAVTSAALLLMPPVFRRVLHREEVYGFVGLTCLAALAQSTSIHFMSYYRATHRPWRFMGAGLLGAVLLIVTTAVVLFKWKLGVPGVLGAFILTYGVLSTAVIVDLAPRIGVGMSWSMIPKLLAYGAPMVFSATGQFTLLVASVFLLSCFAGLEVVAIYSLAWRFSLLMSVGISLPFQLAFQPFLYTNLEHPHVKSYAARMLTYLMLTTTLAAFGLIVATYLLVPIVAPPAYADVFLVVLLLLPGQAFLGMHYFGETLIGAVRRTGFLGMMNSLCAVICVSLNVLLIPALGWLGAVLAVNTAGILSDTVAMGVGLRRFGLVRQVEWGRLGAILGVFIAQLVLAFELRHAAPATFIGIMLLFILLSLALLAAFATTGEKAAVRGAIDRFGARLVARVSAP